MKRPLLSSCLGLLPALLLALGPERAAAKGPALGVAPAGTEAVLYDAAFGGTPDSQGFLFQLFPFNAAATQVYSGGLTTLNTLPQITDLAGYFGRTDQVPTLDRQTGYQLRFRFQLAAEDHAGSDRNGDGLDDRAGLSVIVLSSDLLGIELGFWAGRVWAQEGGTGSALFTQAEGTAFDTTALATYTLGVSGASYLLWAEGQAILSGPLRDYTAFSGAFDPYETPNLVFLGDDTSSARATVHLAYVVATVLDRRLYLPLLVR